MASERNTLMPSLQSAGLLSHHNLHHLSEHRAVWWKLYGREISHFVTNNIVKTIQIFYFLNILQCVTHSTSYWVYKLGLWMGSICGFNCHLQVLPTTSIKPLLIRPLMANILVFFKLPSLKYYTFLISQVQ